MALRVTNLVLRLDEPESLLLRRAAERLGVASEAIAQWQIVRRSLDARGGRVRFVYTVELSLSDSSEELAVVKRGSATAVVTHGPVAPTPGHEEIRGRAVVVGCGPAGLFAALKLAECGYRPLLLERGAPVDGRRRDVARFLRQRDLNCDSNLLFGAGGAGAYSDGKLRTRIRDPRTREILEQLVAAGAPGDILLDARPHIGTDLLHGVVDALCRELLVRGGEILWGTRLTGLATNQGRLTGAVTSAETIETNCLILATGANARDTFENLLRAELAVEPKPFQMGLRLEHPTELVDRAVYGRLAGHPRLGAAEYVLAACSVTSFCVCPGGTLLPACVEPGTVCTNGMSVRQRDSGFTNAALVTTVRPEEFDRDPLAGLAYQRRWEREGFRLGGGDFGAPGQNVPDFISGAIRPLSRRTTYPFEVLAAPVKEALPDSVGRAIAQALVRFEQRIPGFASDAGILVGPETRCSCPVRILRDRRRRVSVSLDGLYPAGEGSGYAGGIMSSAVDGLRSAEAIIARFALPRH